MHRYLVLLLRVRVRSSLLVRIVFRSRMNEMDSCAKRTEGGVVDGGAEEAEDAVKILWQIMAIAEIW